MAQEEKPVWRYQVEDESVPYAKRVVFACGDTDITDYSFICDKCGAEVDCIDEFCKTCGRKIDWIAAAWAEV